MKAVVMRLGASAQEVAVVEMSDDSQLFWNVTQGYCLARARGGLCSFAPQQAGHSATDVLLAYENLDIAYALSTDLSRPVLFVTYRGKRYLADGWHRMYRALTQNVPRLSAYVLTEQETEAILLLHLSPGEEFPWDSEAERRLGL